MDALRMPEGVIVSEGLDMAPVEPAACIRIARLRSRLAFNQHARPSLDARHLARTSSFTNASALAERASVHSSTLPRRASKQPSFCTLATPPLHVSSGRTPFRRGRRAAAPPASGPAAAQHIQHIGYMPTQHLRFGAPLVRRMMLGVMIVVIAFKNCQRSKKHMPKVMKAEVTSTCRFG